MKEDPGRMNASFPQPPFPQQDQEFPGKEWKMEPEPDYGRDSYKGHGRLRGKSTLITGGDSGIGRAVALAFAREGADVAIAYLDEHRDAEETVRLIQQEQRKALRLPGDIQEEAHCRRLVDQVFEDFGHLDILVNNAAYTRDFEKLEDISAEEFARTFHTNIFATFYLCKAALPRMQPGACIINTASIQAFEPSPTLIAYASTKGAIVTFTKALAKLGLKQGVRVNAVAPGATWTPFIPAQENSPEKVANFGKNSPYGRPAQPVELSPIYVFLASDEASYVTGEVYGATGGKRPV